MVVVKEGVEGVDASGSLSRLKLGVDQSLDIGVQHNRVQARLAQRFYPGESPIGRRIGAGNSGPLLEIVGVVADVKQAGLDEPAGTELYFHYPQAAVNGRPDMAATDVTPGSLVASPS